ncbi:hypothetical protein V6O07_20845, partial [Arthrospira platensis SPKY2]
FRKGKIVISETDVKGEKGAYFVHSTLNLCANETSSWQIIANLNLHHGQVIALINEIETNPKLAEDVAADVAFGTQKLIQLAAAADGIQYSADHLKDTRHFSNT